jgi:mannose-6-phosphate isomerase
LHLDAGIKVARGEPHDPALRRHIPDAGTVELADGRYFRADRLDGEPDAAIRAAYPGPLLVIPRRGEVRIGGDVLVPGDCGLAETLDAVAFAPEGQAILVRAA